MAWLVHLIFWVVAVIENALTKFFVIYTTCTTLYALTNKTKPIEITLHVLLVFFHLHIFVSSHRTL